MEEIQVENVLVVECPYCGHILFAVESLLNDEKIVVCERYIDEGLEFGCGKLFIIIIEDGD